MDDTTTMELAPAVRRALPDSMSKVCRGPCGERLPATEEHFYRDRGKLRSICRACYRNEVAERERRARASGLRVCDYCHYKQSIERFALYLGHGKEERRTTCNACVAKLEHPDPMREAEADLAMALRLGQRWAIGLQILLGTRRMSLADYKALRGAARAAFEARWSELLKEMARDAGEWPAEWDDPMRIPSARHDARGSYAPRRVA